jgi:hypothetical protein
MQITETLDIDVLALYTILRKVCTMKRKETLYWF